MEKLPPEAAPQGNSLLLLSSCACAQFPPPCLTKVAFLGKLVFFLSSLCYSIVILQSSMFDSRYSTGYIFFTVSILLYIAISEFGPSPKVDEFALTLQVMSQKIILFIFLCTIYFQASGIQNLRK